MFLFRLVYRVMPWRFRIGTPLCPASLVFLLCRCLTAPCLNEGPYSISFLKGCTLVASIYTPVSHTWCLVGSASDRDSHCIFAMHQQVAGGIPHCDSHHVAGKMSFPLQAGLPWSPAPMLCPGSGWVQWQAIVTVHSHGTTPQENCSVISSCSSLCCQAESKWKVKNFHLHYIFIYRWSGDKCVTASASPLTPIQIR